MFNIFIGSFFCSHCEFKCILNTSMVEHLTSPEHQKVVSVIHRSKPIIIKRLLPIICKNCNQDFALNVELLQHLQVCSPVETKFQFSGVMPSAFVCSTCKKSFQCAVSLQKHHLEVHELTVFYCSICELTFESSTEAKQHRRTSKHKANAQKFRGIVQKPKVCKVCKLVFDNFDGFKQHMFREHPEYTSNCPLCGLKFAISQVINLLIYILVTEIYIFISGPVSPCSR